MHLYIVSVEIFLFLLSKKNLIMTECNESIAGSYQYPLHNAVAVRRSVNDTSRIEDVVASKYSLMSDFTLNFFFFFFFCN